MSKTIDKPAGLTDLNFSRNGEVPGMVATQPESYVPTYDTFDIAEEKYVIFKLADNTKDGGVHLPNEDDVINPKTGKIERIRLLVGIDTIWMKEQKDLTPDYIARNRRTLSFHRGAKILRIKESDSTALEFLRVVNWNIGNPKRRTGSRFDFYEYNPEKQQQEALKKEMKEIEMAIKASNEPEESMRKHAGYLGIQMWDTFGFPKKADGIRSEYILAAKRNPVRFERTLGSKEVEISYLINKAIAENLIDLGGHSGDVAWGSGGRICKVPVGRNTMEYLVELASNSLSQDGKDFLNRLQTIAAK